MIKDFISSIEINSYSFSSDGSGQYSHNHYMANSWPVVYIIKNESIGKAYVGESTNALKRMKNHLTNKLRNDLNELVVISCDKFNKSAVLDIESQLISYIDADKHYTLQNVNAGLVDHNYYQKSQYRFVFESIWKMLLEKKYAKNPIERLDNSDFFKYSPYKSLTLDQHNSLIEVLDLINKNKKNTIFIEGSAGTGKTVLAVYLMKLLNTSIQDFHIDESDEIYSEQIMKILEFKKRYPEPKVAFVIPMTSLRQTLKRVFQSVKGLSGKMVIGPTEVSRNFYDLLLVDEAHRLRQRIGLTSYGSFDEANRLLKFDIDKGTELDWILKQSKNQIFFYDEDQSIKPTDIDKQRFIALKSKYRQNVQLVSQLRVKGGLDYINFVDNLLHCRLDQGDNTFQSATYEMKLYTSLRDLHGDILKREKQYGLCRLLAGYSWPWESKKDRTTDDIELDGLKFKWNTKHIDWINSDNAVNEIGCIHTSQGYDLNYCGVIFGNEIKFDPITYRIEVDESQYFDKKGKQGISNPEVLKEYILNIYKTMMLRGIKGTFLYACDPNLRAYLSKFVPIKVTETSVQVVDLLPLDKVRPFVNAIPIFRLDTAAGEFSDIQKVEDFDWVRVPESFRVTREHFACRVVGESMNKIIPNGSYAIFRKYLGGSRGGQIVLVEHTELQDSDFGSCYTVKEYVSIKNQNEEGWEHKSIILKPCSTDDRYKNIVLSDDDLLSLKVIGVFERLII